MSPIRSTTARCTGRAKIATEQMLRALHDTSGLRYVAFRPFNVYGPRMDMTGVYTEVLIRWLDAIEAGKPPLIFGDGTQSMDFVYVDDVARANLLAAQSDVERRSLQPRHRSSDQSERALPAAPAPDRFVLAARISGRRAR